MVNRKTILLIFMGALSLVLSVKKSFALEALNLNLDNDYIITSESTVNAVVGSPEVVSIKPFFTIFNEKNMILLHPEKVGKTKLTVFQKTGDIVFDICVKEQSTTSTFTPIKKGGIELDLLDVPPFMKDFEIDAPPFETEEN